MRFIFYFFIFLFCLNSLSFVQAIGFSPSSLVYNLGVDEESCESISLSSDSETIMISDKWAENNSVEWRVGLFDYNASFHGINVNYDGELSVDERNVEVCLSGSGVGEYRGVLILREEQKGNSIIQMGIWLKVNISEKTGEPAQETPPQDSGSGSSNSGGSGGGIISTSKEVDKTEEVKLAEFDTEIIDDGKVEKQLDEEEVMEQNGAGITGNVAGGGLIKNNLGMIGGFFIALIIIGAFVYNKRKNSL